MSMKQRKNDGSLQMLFMSPFVQKLTWRVMHWWRQKRTSIWVRLGLWAETVHRVHRFYWRTDGLSTVRWEKVRILEFFGGLSPCNCLVKIGGLFCSVEWLQKKVFPLKMCTRYLVLENNNVSLPFCAFHESSPGRNVCIHFLLGYPHPKICTVHGPVLSLTKRWKSQGSENLHIS